MKTPNQIAIHVLEIQQIKLAREDTTAAYLRASATLAVLSEKLKRQSEEILEQEAAFAASLNQAPA